MGQRAIRNWISRHSYHSAEQTVKNKKLDHRVVKFESDDRQFTINDIERDDLEPFYDFVFARWKDKLAHYFHAPLEAKANIDYGQYL
jgi:hypothetical protein